MTLNLRCLVVWMLVFALFAPRCAVALTPPETVVVEANPYQPTLISFEQGRVAASVPAMPRGTMLTLTTADAATAARLVGNNRLIGTPFRFWVEQAGVRLPELDTEFMLSVTVPSTGVLPNALGLYYYHESLGVWQRVLGELNAETSAISGRFTRTGLFALLVDADAPKPLLDILINTIGHEISLSGKAEPFAHIEVFASDQFLGHGQADLHGQYRLALGLPLGQHVLRLRHIDQAGNVSEQSLTLTRTPERPVHIELTPGSTQVTLNRTLLFLEVPPRIVQGRTVVPLRFVAEALGAAVTWQEDTRSVVVSNGATTIRLHLGSPVATVNDRQVLLDVAPFAERGRTLVPLRFLAETLGFEVLWHSITNRIEIRN